jgi:hypothetical protein
MRTSVLVAVLGLWFVLASSAVAAGVLDRVPVPPPVIVVALAAGCVLGGLLLPKMRAWLMSVDLRWLLAVHLVRFVGIAFLVLVGRGLLARSFLPIGWGDAVAAFGAVALLIAHPALSTKRGWWSVLVWNVFGVADMLMLIITGIRLGRVDPSQFSLFRQLPFGLLPTFFVPLIIATHIFIFVRLFSRRPAPAA